MKQIFQPIKCAFHNIIDALCRHFDIAMLNSPCFKGKAVFGPVKSRRLGYSLGINTMKCKMCTYDCVYCQIGQTPCVSTCRDSCLGPYELFCVVRKKLELLKAQNIPVDYITFVPNGEPTLDANLAKDIVLLREFGHKIAVLTNSSLVWNDRVQQDLMFADYVSIKIDTVNEDTWQRLNRPHSRLRLQTILDGIERFSKSYHGIITTETMLVKNTNDTLQEVEAIGMFLKKIKRNTSYFTIPTRPPLESYAVSPDPHVLSQISDFITNNLPNSEMLSVPEEEIFYGAGEIENELLAVLSAQPMTEKAVKNFITSKGGGRYTLQQLIKSGCILQTPFHGNSFYSIAPSYS
jgi:wyosine [tRNA(Phe)-imidazoG37] synthetase (radical SAM superfamily)